MDIKQILANEIAKGIISTGIEGAVNSVSCSTAGDYPSMGCSQWEGLGGRGDQLLSYIDGGQRFAGRSYSDLYYSGQIPELCALLGSKRGIAAQEMILANDCHRYVEVLQQIPTLDDTRCMIYAGMWCPTSHNVVRAFLQRRYERGYNLRSLQVLHDTFYNEYWIAADVGIRYKTGYENRAIRTYEYVAGIDLTTPYGIPAYGNAGNGR